MNDTTATFRVWVDQPQAFSTERVEAIHHNFHEHPLMQLPELAKLAKDLVATKQCRFITPDTQQASAFAHNADAHDGRAIEDVFRRIEEPGSWVALYNVETPPGVPRVPGRGHGLRAAARRVAAARHVQGRWFHLHLGAALGDAVSHGP